MPEGRILGIGKTARSSRRAIRRTAMDERAAIYIVEDDEPVRDSLAALLEAEGFDVASYASSEQFLEHFHPRGSACLLLDLELPGKSGIDLMRILGAGRHRLPVIVITGKADRSLHARALALGAANVFVKPPNPDMLIASVRRLLH
jgi:FixJ family two-component response regulator